MNMPPVQLTQINTEMEGHEEMRISVQSRMIPCSKTSRNQSILYLFFRESGFAGWDRLTCKKDGFSPKSQRRKGQLQKTPYRRLELEEGTDFCSLCCSDELWRREVRNGTKAACKEWPRSLSASPDRTPKMFSLGIETEETVENFLITVDIFLPPTPDLMSHGR